VLEPTFEGRLLPKKKGGSKTVSVMTDNGLEMIEADPIKKQVIRILYAFLILTSFFKILQVVSVKPSIGFLVEMLSEIGRRAVPFVSFFIYLNITFAFIFYVLNVTFDETRTKDPYGEYQGIN